MDMNRFLISCRT